MKIPYDVPFSQLWDTHKNPVKVFKKRRRPRAHYFSFKDLFRPNESAHAAAQRLGVSDTLIYERRREARKLGCLVDFSA